MRVRASTSRWLPKGHRLDASVWESRHRLVVRVVLLNIPVLWVVGVMNGAGAAHSLMEVAMIALLIAGSTLMEERWLKALLVSLALVSGSAILVHLTGGLIESHFHFFVALPLVALYADWRPFGASVLYVLVHHGVVGALEPGSVYNHPAAMARPVLWSAVHAGFVALLVLVLLVHWRINENEHERTVSARERLSLVIDTSHDAIIQINEDGHIASVNAAGASLLGLPDPSGAIGLLATSVLDPLPIGRPDRIRAVVTAVDGSPTPVEVTSTTTEVEGVVTHALFVRDMSDIDRAMRQLEEAVRAKDELIASVSHEIRTPLTGILGISAEVARDPGSFEPAELAVLLATLTEEAQEMADLVEDLLTSARARIGTLSVQPTDVDMASLVETVARSASMASIGVELQLESDLWGHADPLRVRQIVPNLLSNAQRYGDGAVAVATRTEGAWAVVEVSDGGQALRPYVVEQMFQPYFTGVSAATQPRAIGLGLAVSADLARAMGGSLEFERRDDRNCFVLRLPIVRDLAATPA